MTPKPEPKPERKPSLGRIVTFRSREGVDMPAIITALIPADETAVHLEPFPPPGVGKPALSYEWGVDRAEGDVLDGRWRWPERA